MNAREMFEGLGFRSRKRIDTEIVWTRKVRDDFIEKEIIFNLEVAKLSIEGGWVTKDEMLAVSKQCEELGWFDLDGLSQNQNKSKRETNFEHYKDEIATVDFDFAIKDGEITSCEGCYCSECRFGDSDVPCYIKRMKWLFQEHKEKIRLTRFEYDLIKTFDRCKECCLLNEIECLKKLSGKGYFKGIDSFTKVHDIIDNCEVIK